MMRRFYINNSWYKADLEVDWPVDHNDPLITCTFYTSDVWKWDRALADPYIVLDEYGTLYHGRVVYIDKSSMMRPTQTISTWAPSQISHHSVADSLQMRLVEII